MARALHRAAISTVMFAVELASASSRFNGADGRCRRYMLGDAFVYTLSLFALDRGLSWKAGAVVANGLVILLFAVAVEAILRILYGVPPSSTLMFAFGGAALVANVACLSLLWRIRRQDVQYEQHVRVFA